MEKYRNEMLKNKLEDIENTHIAIIEKIAALKMDLDTEKDGKIEETIRKVHELVSESLKIIQNSRK